MSLLKYVERLKRIDDLIQRKSTGNASEFAAKLGISRSQLLQDLKEFRQLGAIVEFDSFRQTYFYPGKKFILILNSKEAHITGGNSESCLNMFTEIPQWWTGRLPTEIEAFNLLRPVQYCWTGFSHIGFAEILS